jgi:hypothetical protein
LQRFTAVTSVTDLLNEVDETVEYLKTHSGVEVDYGQEDGEIAEEALNNTNFAPHSTFVVPYPERHGARLADKVIQEIAPNENVTKRSHNTIVHIGHKTHPSKSQRIAPTVEPPSSRNVPQVANTFGDMLSQIRQVHKTSTSPM